MVEEGDGDCFERMVVCPTDCQSGLARVGLSGNFVWVEMREKVYEGAENSYEQCVLASCSGDINGPSYNE